MLRSAIFWAIAIIAAAAFFLIGVNSNNMYVGETNILVLPKSDKTARNIEQIIGDAEEIPKSLKFYDILLTENSGVDDQFAALPDYQRKEMWNKMIRVEAKKRSGVLSVRAFSPSLLQASIVSEQVARDIAVVMSRYYDIKTDLDIRIIDGPIVSPQKKFFNLALAAFSLLFGLIIGMIVYFIFGKKSGKAYFPSRTSMNFPQFSVAKAPERNEIKTEVRKDIPAEESFAKKETTMGGARKAGAPENLPVGSEFVVGALRRSAKATQKEEERDVEPKTHEASEEEIRARLNKLLGGKF